MAAATVELPSGVHKLNTTTDYQVSARTTAIKDKESQKQHVETVLNFFKPNEDGSAPHPAYINKPETYERPDEKHNVIISDVTGDEHKYSLDSHGFQFVPHVSREKDFVDEEQIKDQYYKEVDQLLKDVTGATRTFIFDHTIRRPVKDAREKELINADANPQADEGKEVKTKAPFRGPVRRVHIDQSYAAAASRVPYHLPSEAETLQKGRVQIINVWRPIKTVKKDPLAVAEAQSVAEEDLVPIGLIYEKRKGETLAVRYNDAQRWFYKYRQTPGEVLLIKCFDNRAGAGSEARFEGRAKRVPHSAFEVEGTEGEEERESIEVRCLVFHEDDVE